MHTQPYQGRDENETRDKMIQATYDLKPLEFCDPFAKDLIARLLDKNPDTRITAHAALEHPFLKDTLSTAKNEDGVEKVGCWCFGKRMVKGQAFKDPSQHSARYTGAIIPSTVDCSVKAGGRGNPYGNGNGMGELLRSDHLHMRAR